MKRVVLALAIAASAAASIGFALIRSKDARHSSRNETTAGVPRFILWAWERPTNLRFIDPSRVGVAFLAKTIRIAADRVESKPRLQALDLPPNAKLIAVTRIETDRNAPPQLSNEQRDAVVAAIAQLSALPNVREIQIDFDATKSQRGFYRELIVQLRRRLPSDVRLSITALASWCMDDDWISDLPIDEAVPMLFRMAGDGRSIINRLNSGDDFNSPACRGSYGISTDESRPQLISARKLYVFSADVWTEDSVHKLLETNK